MAIFYIPHDPTLTYLMRNSKQHRVVSPAVSVRGRLCTWQSRHVLLAPNDVFICNPILLRTHYWALTARRSGTLDSVFWLLAVVAGTHHSCQSWHRHSRWGKSWDSTDITSGVWPRPQPRKTQLSAARRDFKTKLPRNLRYLVWHSQNGHLGKFRNINWLYW